MSIESPSSLATLELEWKQRGLLESKEEIVCQRNTFDAIVKVISTRVGQASSAASDIQQIVDSNMKKEAEKQDKEKEQVEKY